MHPQAPSGGGAGVPARLLREAGRPLWEARSAFAPGGNAVASSAFEVNPYVNSLDQHAGTVIVHRLDGTRGSVTLPGRFVVDAPTWSPEGRRLALIDDSGDLTLWDAATGRLIARAATTLDWGSSTPAFEPGGDVLFVYRETKRFPDERLFLEWEPGRARLRGRLVPAGEPGSFLGKLVPAPGGRAFVTTGHILDRETLRRRFSLTGHDDRVLDVALSPDGRTVATASMDRTVRLWGFANGRELLVLEGHSGVVSAVAFAPDGRALASCADAPDGGIEVIVWRADHP